MKERVLATRILVLILSMLLGALMTACGSSGGDDSKDNGDGDVDGGGCQYSSINGTWQCVAPNTGGCNSITYHITLTRTDDQVTVNHANGSQTVPLNGNTFVFDASDPESDQVTATCTISSNCNMSCRLQGQNFNTGVSKDCISSCTK